jgi:translation initiation factor 1
MGQDWKDRLGVVFSTNPEFSYENNQEEESETLPPNQQSLLVFTDRKGRKGKTATIISGFVGKEDDLKELSKFLKTKCGVGGSHRGDEILIQGDVKNKVVALLKEKGYKVKVSGG